jgi:Baseplate J-like protein
MYTPAQSLGALSFVSPAGAQNTVSIDSTVFPFTVAADADTTFLQVTAYGESYTLTSFTEVNGANQFTGSFPVDTTQSSASILFVGRNYSPSAAWASRATWTEGQTLVDTNGSVQLVIVGGTAGTTVPDWSTSGTTDDGGVTWFLVGTPSISPTSQITLLYTDSGLSLAIGPPTGISSLKSTSTCTIQWVVPSYAGFIGVRVQVSTDPTGITVPYTQYGSVVSAISSSSNQVISSSTSTAIGASSTVITTTQNTAPINLGSATVSYSDINAPIFYAMVSTLVQDPGTNIVYESQLNGPLICGFVDLTKVNPTDFLALQRKEDIAGRMIAQINRMYPNLDLSPRSELRDLIIDPIAIELANMSVREWFSRVSTSISAISQVDNSTGYGTSDPVSSSSTKQMIQAAYGLSSADTQTLINTQFDILGEQAGVPRGAATYAVGYLTFYTHVKPTASFSVPVGAVVSTLPSASTASVLFTTTGSAVLNFQNAASYYDSVNLWWGITVPCQCQTTGTVGNAGAGTATQPVSNVPSGLSVTNLLNMEEGTDNQSNASYAALIQDRIVTGKDSSTRNGYLSTALSIPSILSASVVAANDLNMLRDWDPVQQKHIGGCVDIYTKGTALSQQTEMVYFSYGTSGTYGAISTYQPLTLISNSLLKFSLNGAASLPNPPLTAIEFAVTRGGLTVYLGCQLAKFDAVDGFLFLNPSETAYSLDSEGNVTPITLANGSVQTNLQFLQAVGQSTNYTYAVLFRYESGLVHTPTLQPVMAINSVQGPVTGLIPSNLAELIYTEDFLLQGGSNQANDTVSVAGTHTNIATATLSFVTNQATLGSNISVPVNSDGTFGNILSVRSTDLSTPYVYGTDYTIVSAGSYNTYALSLPSGSAILTQTVAAGQYPSVIAAFSQRSLNENLTFVSGEVAVLSGTSIYTLDNQGFVYNSWIPISHGLTGLSNDGELIAAGVAPVNRYIKVVYSPSGADIVMLENLDYTLTVNPVSGSASISRITTGGIPTGAKVTINYYYFETFTVVTEYPAFVETLASNIAITQAACADVLVKAMMESTVDITAGIYLTSTANQATVDSLIRSGLSLLVSNANTSLAQSAVIRQIQAVPGVASVKIPLAKCTKSDGQYDIGLVIPTSTPWTVLSQDSAFKAVTSFPSNSFISTDILLTNSTIPGGGVPYAYVGMLHEGDIYRRASTIQDFLTNSLVPSFYIIGTNDNIDGYTPLGSNYWGKILITVPSTVSTPGLLPFRVTYQVWGMTGAQDIVTSSCEYLGAGAVTLNYLTSTTSTSIS